MLPSPTPAYDFSPSGLRIWPDASFETEVYYEFGDSPSFAPQVRHGALFDPLPELERSQVLFREAILPWQNWVVFWDAVKAGIFRYDKSLLIFPAKQLQVFPLLAPRKANSTRSHAPAWERNSATLQRRSSERRFHCGAGVSPARNKQARRLHHKNNLSPYSTWERGNEEHHHAQTSLIHSRPDPRARIGLNGHVAAGDASSHGGIPRNFGGSICRLERSFRHTQRCARFWPVPERARWRRPW